MISLVRHQTIDSGGVDVVTQTLVLAQPPQIGARGILCVSYLYDTMGDTVRPRTTVTQTGTTWTADRQIMVAEGQSGVSMFHSAPFAGSENDTITLSFATDTSVSVFYAEFSGLRAVDAVVDAASWSLAYTVPGVQVSIGPNLHRVVVTGLPVSYEGDDIVSAGENDLWVACFSAGQTAAYSYRPQGRFVELVRLSNPDLTVLYQTETQGRAPDLTLTPYPLPTSSDGYYVFTGILGSFRQDGVPAGTSLPADTTNILPVITHKTTHVQEAQGHLISQLRGD